MSNVSVFELLVETLREKPVLSTDLYPIQTGYIHYPALFYKTVLFTNQYRAWRGISVSPGFPLFRSSVCLSVCPETTGHSFGAIDLEFGTQHPCAPRKKLNFYFFEFQIFRGTFAPFYPEKR